MGLFFNIVLFLLSNSDGFILDSGSASCKDMTKDCSNALALKSICGNPATEQFCQRSCGLCDRGSIVNRTQCVGGRGGHPFTDNTFVQYGNVTSIKLSCSSRYMFIVEMRYGDQWAPMHGGDSPNLCPEILNGHFTTFTFSSTEFLQGVSITHSTDPVHGKGEVIIESVTFKTNENTLPTCGYFNLSSQNQTFINFDHFLYLSGRSGCLLDQMCFHWTD